MQVSETTILLMQMFLAMVYVDAENVAWRKQKINQNKRITMSEVRAIQNEKNIKNVELRVVLKKVITRIRIYVSNILGHVKER